MRRRLLGRFAALRAYPLYFWSTIVSSLFFFVAAIYAALHDHADWAGFLLSIAVLAVAAATLFATLPTPAELWIALQSELELDDVIFCLYDESGSARTPRDILFQTHVIVANVGGRKAVLSALRLEALLDEHGDEVVIPGFALPVQAQLVRQGSGWRIEDSIFHRNVFLDVIQGPYILEPDDVITMRLRARPGIDWSDLWTLDRLQALAATLQRPIEGVRVMAIYRRGRAVVKESFVLKPLKVVQQEEYVSQLSKLTDGFRARPIIAERPITD